MKTRSRSNALLVELLIVVLFFMLAATVLMQVFAKARTMGSRARLTAEVTAEAQSMADRLYTAENPEKALADMGFTPDGALWRCKGPGYITTVTLTAAQDGFTRQELTVTDSAGETLLTLPCSRLREVSP